MWKFFVQHWSIRSRCSKRTARKLPVCGVGARTKSTYCDLSTFGPTLFEIWWPDIYLGGPYGPVKDQMYWPELARGFEKCAGPAGQCLCRGLGLHNSPLRALDDVLPVHTDAHVYKLRLLNTSDMTNERLPNCFSFSQDNLRVTNSLTVEPSSAGAKEDCLQTVSAFTRVINTTMLTAMALQRIYLVILIPFPSTIPFSVVVSKW